MLETFAQTCIHDTAFGHCAHLFNTRPASIAKDVWERLPHLQNHLQLLGPKLFTEEELRGVGEIPSLPEEPVCPQADGEHQGLDEADTYADGPTHGDEDVDNQGGPSSSSGGDTARVPVDKKLDGWKPCEPDTISSNSTKTKKRIPIRKATTRSGLITFSLSRTTKTRPK